MNKKYRMRLVAPAKINLFLHITGKRPDGYHMLESIFVPLVLHDTVVIEPADTVSCLIEGGFAPYVHADDNTLLRVANSLQAFKHKAFHGARLTLHKNIPVAAGLGGGSSDAASVLKGLNQLWQCGLSPVELQDIGLKIGADVAFFLEGKAAFVSGIGEHIAPLPHLPSLPLVLVNPAIPLSTVEVYKANTVVNSKPCAHEPCPAPFQEFITYLQHKRNDLEQAAISLFPGITEVIEALKRLPSCMLARMSGSGATCFGIFPSSMAAQEAAAILQERYPEWWVAVTRTM